MKRQPEKIRKSFVVLFTCIIFLAGIKIQAQNPPPDIPAYWPAAPRQAMITSRDKLITHRKTYDDRVKDFNTKCGGQITPDQTTLIAYCQKESDAIDAESIAIDNETDVFWDDFFRYELKYPPNTNPMVVVTYNTNSGIPAATEKAIDIVFKNAPPGVIERVRKAFQSISGVRTDWPVAKAWLQEALLIDPGNQNLIKLIALCP